MRELTPDKVLLAWVTDWSRSILGTQKLCMITSVEELKALLIESKTKPLQSLTIVNRKMIESLRILQK